MAGRDNRGMGGFTVGDARSASAEHDIQDASRRAAESRLGEGDFGKKGLKGDCGRPFSLLGVYDELGQGTD